jgi:hypothetical protein
MYVCMFSTADLEIRNVPFPRRVSSDSDYALGTLKVPIWDLLGFRLKT